MLRHQNKPQRKIQQKQPTRHITKLTVHSQSTKTTLKTTSLSSTTSSLATHTNSISLPPSLKSISKSSHSRSSPYLTSQFPHRSFSTTTPNPDELKPSLSPPPLESDSNKQHPLPQRENPTEKKIKWLNERLVAPPPPPLLDSDLPDTIPNLNDPANFNDFFSTSPFLYTVDDQVFSKDEASGSIKSTTIMSKARQNSLLRERQLNPKTTINNTIDSLHTNTPLNPIEQLHISQIDSMSSQSKLKQQQIEQHHLQHEEEIKQQQLHILQSHGQINPHDLHGSLGDEIEPPNNLGIEMDNKFDPTAKQFYKKIHQQESILEGIDAVTHSSSESELQHNNINNNQENMIDQQNHSQSQTPPQYKSKLDQLYRYEDQEDSFLYDSVDPYATKREQREKNQQRHDNIQFHREKTRQEIADELLEAQEMGEDIAETKSFEHIHAEIANEVLHKQSLAAYIMSKKSELIPPQARPIFWHGLIPHSDSIGSLIPGLDNLQQKEPDLDWRTFLDLSQPHLWYPTARLLKRKIIFHSGPTNSGKTHRAMLRLKEAESGLYCGPLRLLAWENYEKLQAQGIPCSLLTGQEVIDTPGAKHISSTVEMVNLDRVVDVAVIDEIQMIQDRDRGFAWTRALLGIPAKEIHICGDATAFEWIQDLTAIIGEELHICHYKRLSPLSVEDEPVMGYQYLRKGDCVVAFSRNDVYSLKSKIEHFTGKRCAIIYGNLPPDIRRQQAQQFNDGTLEILVASDAIGMGINLNIGRIIFSSILKFDGEQFRRLQQTEILQIAGRAGRFNTPFHHGLVNVMNVPEDLEYIREQFQYPLPLMTKAQLFPTTEHLLSFCEKFPQIKLSHYLQSLPTRAKVSSLFEICDPTSMVTLSRVIDNIEMPVYNRVMLCYAPLSLERFKSHRPLLEELATALITDKPIPIPKITYAARPVMPQTPAEVALLEETFSNLEVYVWLWYRMGDQLYMHRQAQIDREMVQKIILHYLQHSYY